MPEVTIRFSDQELAQLEAERARSGAESLQDYIQSRLVGAIFADQHLKAVLAASVASGEPVDWSEEWLEEQVRRIAPEAVPLT